MRHGAFLRFSGRLSRILLLVSASLVGTLLASSCLTPDFAFDDEGGDGDLGEGGANGSGGGPSVSHCNNRSIDSDETDTDCGGMDCDPCALGRDCEVGSDCVNGSCTNSRCQDPTCTDDEKNATETDVDCGGTGCPACADDEVCLENSDCESKHCLSGRCAAPTCEDRIENGTESDIDCGGSCDPCESGDKCLLDEDCLQPPEEDPSVSTCIEGICTLECDTRLADCNLMAADGCEINIFDDPEHCGACEMACDPAHAVAGRCNDGTCEIDFDAGGCEAPWKDCNGQHDDGCEINTNTNAAHCSDCNLACSSANGTPTCAGGGCTIACVAGYEDCDGDARANGCEIDTQSNAAMCGTCDIDCHEQADDGESAYCLDGGCGFTTCPSGSGDCSGTGSCDDDLDTVQNCGGCGEACSAQNATVGCADQGGGTFACEITGCVDGGSSDFENCDGSYANGCETNVESSVTHCGGCNTSGGQNCVTLANTVSLHIASINCESGGCRITGCSTGYADCDTNPNNGCEVNTNSTDARCGGCLAADPRPGNGENCDTKWAHANGTCDTGVCTFTACQTNWGNCAGGLTDGCETDLLTTEAHCGSCDDPCSTDAYTTSNTCNSGQCTAVCNANGAKCDSNERNGCENIATDEDNCGACGNICGGAAGTNVSTASCSAKACVVACSNDFCADESSAALCTQSLGTVDNCASCGDVCGAAEPFCTASGCLDHLQIEEVNFSTTALGDSSGSLTFTHTLATARADNAMRAVLVFVGYDGNNTGLPAVVTYAGTTMNSAEHLYSGNQSWSGIYFLLDAALPAGGGVARNVVVTTNSNNTHGTSARVVELINVDQSQPFGPEASKAGQQGCGTTSQQLTGLAEDSWVFSMLTVVNDVPVTSTGSQTAYGTRLYSGGSSMNAGRTENVTTSSTHAWSCTGTTENWSHVMISLQPEGTGP